MMSFGMNDQHISYQMDSVRDQVARSRGRSAHRENTAGIGEGGRKLPSSRLAHGLRRRVGFTLVEAGLRLLPEGSHR